MDNFPVFSPAHGQYFCAPWRNLAELSVVLNPLPRRTGKTTNVRHEFSLRAQWQDTTHPQRGFSRNVDIQADGPGEIRGSAAKPFHGDTTRWNPEQLLLAALAECHVLSYLYVAAEAGITVTQIQLGAQLTLEFNDDGGHISSATLAPEVWLADESQRDQAQQLHSVAHEKCFIARSIKFPVDFTFPVAHQMPDLPNFSSRLGAPIAVLKPRKAKKPSKVTGLENRPVPVKPISTTQDPNHPAEQRSFYDQVGGEATFTKLAAEFYARVAKDEEFKAMYPEEDLKPAEERLRLFLTQYWGGPSTYSERRGHPRLRMRHQPFHIGPKERETWLTHMKGAMDTLGLSTLHYETMWDYFVRAARAMQNAAE